MQCTERFYCRDRPLFVAVDILLPTVVKDYYSSNIHSYHVVVHVAPYRLYYTAGQCMHTIIVEEA